MSRTISIDIPNELIELLGSEDEIIREAKQALVLDLVRKGKISKAKAAEILNINLWDMPEFLSRYKIPWFDYSKEQLEKDLEILRKFEKKADA